MKEYKFQRVGKSNNFNGSGKSVAYHTQLLNKYTIDLVRRWKLKHFNKAGILPSEPWPHTRSQYKCISHYYHERQNGNKKTAAEYIRIVVSFLFQDVMNIVFPSKIVVINKRSLKIVCFCFFLTVCFLRR